MSFFLYESCTMTSASLHSVLFDWAGTLIDPGSVAPVVVFQKIFEHQGIPVTLAQAREPMGMGKREHIAAICRMPTVESAWKERYGQIPGDSEIDELYRQFLPLQLETLAHHDRLIEGTAEAVRELRRQGLAIGSSTGYTRALMEPLLKSARQQGLEVDCCICSDDVPAGRPKPWMIHLALQRLDRFPAWGAVVVDDTLVGIRAGSHAGCWTVAVSESGNEMGLPADQLAAMPKPQRERRREEIERRFAEAGADLVIASVAQLPQAIEQIRDGIHRGRLPRAFHHGGG
jgi:phosphonoacetaldehyde hydrolase